MFYLILLYHFRLYPFPISQIIPDSIIPLSVMPEYVMTGSRGPRGEVAIILIDFTLRRRGVRVWLTDGKQIADDRNNDRETTCDKRTNEDSTEQVF